MEFLLLNMLAQLQTRVETHPDELVDVFRSLSNAYHSTKELKHKDTKLALHTLDSIMHKIHCLQRLPSDSVPLSYDLWSKHLARIYNCCYNDRQTIQNEHTKWARMEAPTSSSNIAQLTQNTNTNELRPWITDWNDETLQSPAVLQIVKRMVMPILFPHTKTSTKKLPPTLVVEGPAYTGKSHLLHTIRAYLKKHTSNVPHLNVQWTELPVYLCPELSQYKMQMTHKHSSANINEWNIYVTDRASTDTLEKWSTAPWCLAWHRHLQQTKNTLWVILLTTSDTLADIPSQDVPMFQHRIALALPNAHTVYHYLKKRIFMHYATPQSDGKMGFPSFVNLPIVHHLPQLAHFVDLYVKDTQPQFEQLNALFESAITWCHSCALRGNAMYGIADEAPSPTNRDSETLVYWYPKNAVDLSKLPQRCEYKLLQHSKHDRIEWCPQTQHRRHDMCSVDVSTFWNTYLLDTLPSSEYDRFSHIYIDPNSLHQENHTYSLIGTFPIEAHIFPFHLNSCLQNVYEWCASFGCAIAHLHQAKNGEFICASTTDILTMPEKRYSELFGGFDPCQLSFHDVTSPMQVWYIERERATEESVLPHVHIRYKERSSSTIAEYVKGVPGNVSAETMQKILSVLVNRPDTSQVCNVLQIQTQFGYAYYIDFKIPLEAPFHMHCLSDNCQSTSYPRVSLPLLHEGYDLSSNYRICTESDVDTLIEKYPKDYKDVYRDEEVTWKLKPLRKPAHINCLNVKYTNEQKYYLKLYCDLLCTKESYYSCLSVPAREVLDDALMDMQNHIDYLLQIIPENDHTGKWNDVWSMDDNHPLFDEYHPPEHNEVDKVIGVNLATEWLRKDASFHVSPRWLHVLCGIGELHHSTHLQNDNTLLTEILRTWKVFHQNEVQKSTQWIYVKATIEKRVWNNVTSVEKLYDCARHHPIGARGESIIREYCKRTDTSSLFHIMFEHAEHIGYHHYEDNAIHWMTFEDYTKEDPLEPVLAELQKVPQLWLLMHQNTPEEYQSWLFALRHMKAKDERAYRAFYAHLLFSPKLCIWSMDMFEQKNKHVLEHIQNADCINHFIRQYAYIHKKMYRQPLQMNSTLPGVYERSAVCNTETVSSAPQMSSQEKKVLSGEELQRVRMFGMNVHHLSDSALCTPPL